MLAGQSGGKINYFLKKTNITNIIIMGNSRAYNQIIPDSLGNDCYNLAHAGMKQTFQTGLLSILESNKKIPNTILLHVEPSEFLIGKEDKSIQKLKYYYGTDSIVTKYINEISFYERFKFIFSSYRFNGQFLNIVKSLVKPDSSDETVKHKGWRFISSTSRDSINVFYSIKTYQKQLLYPFDDKLLEHLFQFIKICKKRNTNLICFTSPQFITSKEEIEIANNFQKILEKYNIKYFNYLDHPIPELIEKPMFWKDAMHLNQKGASIESSDIRNKLILLHLLNP